jgi:outer membrane protein OmpU
MKKVLFATTALIATAGIASAEVSVSGWAEMGIQKSNANGINSGGDYNTISVLGVATDGTGQDDSKTRFFQDFNVKFSMSGTTDGGMTFGANVELRDTNGYTGSHDDNGTDIYLKSAFGNLTLGNTDGAMDWAMSEVGIGGSIADNETSHGGYMGDYGDGEYDGQILRYDNTFGDFGIAISAELNDNIAARANGFAIGAKYGMDLGGTKVNFGLGYQTFVQGAAVAVAADNAGASFGQWRAGWMAGDKITMTGISVDAEFNGITGKLEYTQINNGTTAGTNVRHTGIGLGYKMDALTLGANWGRFDAAAPAANVVNNDVQGFGVTADYDLGGGAIVQAGYGSTARYQSDGATAGGVKQTGNAYSIGLRLNF